MMAMTMQIPLENDHPMVSVAEVEAFTMELCTICSNYYEKQQRSYAQPFVNRLICKLLDVTWDARAYFNSYIAICPECTNRVKTFERKRVELDILRQEVVSCVLDTLMHIRPDDNTPLHSLKRPILLRWAKEIISPEMLPSENVVPQEIRLESKAAPDSRRKSSQNSQPTVQAPRGAGLIQENPPRAVGQGNQVASGSDSSEVLQEPRNSGTSVEQSGTDHQANDGPTNVTVWENVVHTDQTYSSSLQLLAVATENYISENIQEHSTVNYGDIYVEDNTAADNDCEDSEDDDDAGNDGQQEGEVVIPEQIKLAGNTKKKRTRSPAKPKPPQHQKPPYLCEVCGEVFSYMKPLLRHAKPKTCSEEDAYTAKECSICGDDFSSSTWLELKFHIDTKHPNCKIDKCRICKKEFLPNTMAWHKCDELEHRLPKELPCDYCDKMYYTSGSLSKHMYRKHINSQDEKAFKCDICNRMFISNSLLTLHKATHKPSEQIFSCPTCGIGMSSSKSLSTHIKLHTLDKSCTCETCGKGFRTQTALTVHKLSHASVKKYRCEICDKLFTTHSTMHRHVKKHFNPLPGKKEQCPICKSGTTYHRTYTLQKHMLTFHKGTLEQIEICTREPDPEEELIFSQSKTPQPSRTPNLKRNSSTKISKSAKKRSRPSPGLESETEGIENNGLDSNKGNDKNVKIECSEHDQKEVTPIRTLSMTTRRGGKRTT